MADSRRCFRRRWVQDRGDRRSSWGHATIELADFAPFEIAPEAYDADVARREPFSR